MTEEIIIDGVNVAGCCKCYNVEQKILCGASGICANNPNCYYKQLKRLEQENKALKDNNNRLQVIIDDGRAENKRFREENKELKKDVQLFKCLDTFGESECHCACRCLGNEFCEDADKKINSYRSALEEIRGKIESLNKDICNNCGWYNTDNCQPNGYVCHDLIEIKNKINEVLNDK